MDDRKGQILVKLNMSKLKGLKEEKKISWNRAITQGNEKKKIWDNYFHREMLSPTTFRRDQTKSY